MSPAPQDTPLPISAAAVIGVWVNTTPVPLGDGSIFRLLLRLTLEASGEAAFHSEGMLERDGQPRSSNPTIISRAGTWALENDAVVLHMPTRSRPRDELTLVQRRASDGLTRVVLRSSSGGVLWRPDGV
jgi:hypothetical protein